MNLQDIKARKKSIDRERIIYEKMYDPSRIVQKSGVFN
eukprot:UN16355